MLKKKRSLASHQIKTQNGEGRPETKQFENYQKELVESPPAFEGEIKIKLLIAPTRT